MVARLVPERVVDDLEVVEVEEDDRERCRRALPQCERIARAARGRAVGSAAGEGVVQRVLAQLVLQGSADVDVGERSDDALDAAAVRPHPERAASTHRYEPSVVRNPVLEADRLGLADRRRAHAPTHLRLVVR